jgi:hypothetical protein
VTVRVATFAALLFASEAMLEAACPRCRADVPEPPDPQALTVHADMAAAARNGVSRTTTERFTPRLLSSCSKPARRGKAAKVECQRCLAA